MSSASLRALQRDLKGFADRKEVIKALRAEVRAPLPAVRQAIKARALNTLPKTGGLNKWTSRTRITARVTVGSSRIQVRLTGSRNSLNGASDIRSLDRGRIRHPSWGRRGRGQWHTQLVTPGFFSDPATEVEVWRRAALKAVDKAVKTLHG